MAQPPQPCDYTNDVLKVRSVGPEQPGRQPELRLLNLHFGNLAPDFWPCFESRFCLEYDVKVEEHGNCSARVGQRQHGARASQPDESHDVNGEYSQGKRLQPPESGSECRIH